MTSRYRLEFSLEQLYRIASKEDPVSTCRSEIHSTVRNANLDIAYIRHNTSEKRCGIKA